ncbi:hypothetical protein JCM3765_001526 [Sporobolomyces pararoseus]
MSRTASQRSAKPLLNPRTSSSTSSPSRPLQLVPGLTPTFYPLECPEKINEIPIRSLDLGDNVYLKDFDDGTLEGLRRWNAEHEALIKWLYDPRGRCLVDRNWPLEHYHELAEQNYSVRQRGIADLASSADRVNNLLNSPRFTPVVVTPWLALSSSQQEKILLEALAHIDRTDPPGSQSFARSRKLLPEVIIQDLLSNEGKGLVSLFDYLGSHLPDGDKLAEYPIYNENFFRKFGIPTEDGEVPLPEADRAFHQEYLMRRHSLLFEVVETVVRRIIGQPDRALRVGNANYKSELTRKNDPDLADKPASIDLETLTKNFEFLTDERCSCCRRTACQAGMKQLLYCERCRKIDRIEPYCSANCQKSEWKKHKEHCGSRVSTFCTPPIIAAQSSRSHPSATSHLPPLRRFIRRSLEWETYLDDFWTYDSGRNGIGFLSPLDKEQTLRIRQAMRALSFKALETADQDSVSLLAFVMFNMGARLGSLTEEGKKKTKKIGPSDDNDERAKNREDQFRETFGIKNEEEWKETLLRGRLELLKPEHSVVKEFYLLQIKQVDYQREELLERMFCLDDSKAPRSFMRLMLDTMLGPM